MSEREAAVTQLAEAVRYWLTRHEMYLGVDRSDGQGWREPESFAAEVVAELGSDDDSLAAEAALTVSEWEPWIDHSTTDIPPEWWATSLGRLTLLASAQTSGEVTVAEACAMLRVTRARVYQLLDAGKLKRGPGGSVSRRSVMRRLVQARRDRETLVQHRQAYYASRMQTQTLMDLAEVRAAAKDGRARRARTAAGLTQAEVGAACGVSHAAISRWESGQRVPRGPAAKRYARLLGALLERLDQ